MELFFDVVQSNTKDQMSQVARRHGEASLPFGGFDPACLPGALELPPLLNFYLFSINQL
jgi:hypothetical protein